MKKITILVLTILLALSFAACDKQKTAAAPEGEKVYLKDPAVDFVATVDEAGWDAAMTAQNFENVTMYAYSLDSAGVPFMSVKIAGDRSYRFSEAEKADSEGPAYRYEHHYYYYTEDGKYYFLDNSTNINTATDASSTRYRVEQTETYEGITAQSFVENEDGLMKKLTGQYSRFTYDEEERLYVGTIEGTQAQIEVSFQDGKLVYVKLNMDDYWQSWEFVDYGTTNVEIPEEE